MAPLFVLVLLAIVGFGVYRAFKFDTGKRRFWGLVPVVLVLLGGVVAPFCFGVMTGMGVKPSVMGIGGDEALIVVIVGSMLLAVASGSILALAFRPRR